MTKFIIFIFVMSTVLIGFDKGPHSFAYQQKVKGQWSEYKSEHFLVYYKESIPQGYVKEFTRTCERYYDLITDRLGFNRFDFWLWEDRAKIFIFKTREEYTEETKRPEWSGASVSVKKKIINTFYFAEDFFDMLLPHELTHIILREFIGLKTRVPLWFDEGVACANENNSYDRYFLLTKGLVGQDVYLPVQEMERLTSETMKVPTVFYATSASLIIYLRTDYRKIEFMEFCRELRDGKRFYQAMDKIYGIKNAEDMNAKFVSFMQKQSYEDIIEKQKNKINW